MCVCVCVYGRVGGLAGWVDGPGGPADGLGRWAGVRARVCLHKIEFDG